MTVFTAIELKRKFLCIESDDKDIDIFLSNCTRLRRNMEMRLAETETAAP